MDSRSPRLLTSIGRGRSFKPASYPQDQETRQRATIKKKLLFGDGSEEEEALDIGLEFSTEEWEPIITDQLEEELLMEQN